MTDTDTAWWSKDHPLSALPTDRRRGHSNRCHRDCRLRESPPRRSQLPSRRLPRTGSPQRALAPPFAGRPLIGVTSPSTGVFVIGSDSSQPARRLLIRVPFRPRRSNRGPHPTSCISPTPALEPGDAEPIVRPVSRVPRWSGDDEPRDRDGEKREYLDRRDDHGEQPTGAAACRRDDGGGLGGSVGRRGGRVWYRLCRCAARCGGERRDDDREQPARGAAEHPGSANPTTRRPPPGSASHSSWVPFGGNGEVGVAGSDFDRLGG